MMRSWKSLATPVFGIILKVEVDGQTRRKECMDGLDIVKMDLRFHLYKVLLNNNNIKVYKNLNNYIYSPDM